MVDMSVEPEGYLENEGVTADKGSDSLKCSLFNTNTNLSSHSADQKSIQEDDDMIILGDSSDDISNTEITKEQERLLLDDPEPDEVVACDASDILLEGTTRPSCPSDLSPAPAVEDGSGDVDVFTKMERIPESAAIDAEDLIKKNLEPECTSVRQEGSTVLVLGGNQSPISLNLEQPEENAENEELKDIRGVELSLQVDSHSTAADQQTQLNSPKSLNSELLEKNGEEVEVSAENLLFSNGSNDHVQQKIDGDDDYDEPILDINTDKNEVATVTSELQEAEVLQYENNDMMEVDSEKNPQEEPVVELDSSKPNKKEDCVKLLHSLGNSTDFVTQNQETDVLKSPLTQFVDSPDEDVLSVEMRNCSEPNTVADLTIQANLNTENVEFVKKDNEIEPPSKKRFLAPMKARDPPKASWRWPESEESSSATDEMDAEEGEENVDKEDVQVQSPPEKTCLSTMQARVCRKAGTDSEDSSSGNDEMDTEESSSSTVMNITIPSKSSSLSLTCVSLTNYANDILRHRVRIERKRKSHKSLLKKEDSKASLKEKVDRLETTLKILQETVASLRDSLPANIERRLECQKAKQPPQTVATIEDTPHTKGLNGDGSPQHFNPKGGSLGTYTPRQPIFVRMNSTVPMAHHVRYDPNSTIGSTLQQQLPTNIRFRGRGRGFNGPPYQSSFQQSVFSSRRHRESGWPTFQPSSFVTKVAGSSNGSSSSPLKSSLKSNALPNDSQALGAHGRGSLSSETSSNTATGPPALQHSDHSPVKGVTSSSGAQITPSTSLPNRISIALDNSPSVASRLSTPWVPPNFPNGLCAANTNDYLGMPMVTVALRSQFSDFIVARKLYGEISYPKESNGRYVVRIHYWIASVFDEWQCSPSSASKNNGMTKFSIQFHKNQTLQKNDKICFVAEVCDHFGLRLNSSRYLYHLHPENPRFVALDEMNAEEEIVS